MITKTAPWALLACVALLTACGGAQDGGPDDSSRPEEQLRGESIVMWVTAGEEPLPIYRVDGRDYLLGRHGDRYQIWLANRTDRRIEAVVSVDGRDVVSGREADYLEDRGYIIAPGEELRIEGFRKSLSGVAAFEFSDVSESYAARMGDASNVGIIGVAVFDEEEHAEPPAPIAGGDDRDREERRAPGGGGGGPYPAAQKSAGAPIETEDADEPGLGTRYGDEIGSAAEIVPFRRRDPERPLEMLGLYYEDRRGLERRGVVFEDSAGTIDPDGPNPFPGSPRDGHFAPPPPPVY
jgi:hypothetical protein